MRLADPEGSKAILIGAAQYDDPALAEIAQARTNVDDLAAILAAPELGGFLPGNVRTMVNPRHKEDAGLEIARWCRTATDTLVVYYTGHGLVDINGELLLATSDTIEAEKEYLSLRAEMLRRAVNQSDAKIKIFIVDCCYSGRAFGQAMANEASGVLDQIETTGTCGLASAPRHLASLFVEGERHTVFSGELITVLREGLPDEGALLSLFAVYRELRRRMRKREHPEPKIVHSDSVSEFALVRNRAHHPAEKRVPRAERRPTTPGPAPVSARALASPRAPAAAPAPSSPAPAPAPAPWGTRSLLHTIAEADAFVAGFPGSGTTDTELATAASHPSWPVLARLRFVSELVHTGERFFALQALEQLLVLDRFRALDAIHRLRKDLVTGQAWKTEEWDVGELIPETAQTTDIEARQLWGIAMAMLLTAAGLPTRVRIQAIEELAELGHRDEAGWIARGMLRDRRADPALVTEVRTFLSRVEAGTPGPTGADRSVPRQSGRAAPPI
jgi:hypothetical protein